MSYLPDELAKLRDELADKEASTYQREIKDQSWKSPYRNTQAGFVAGFDVGALAMEAYMQAEMDKLEAALEKLDQGFKGYSNDTACFFCDRGDAGYSSKGPGYHDDDPEKCPALFTHEALASYHAWKDK